MKHELLNQGLRWERTYISLAYSCKNYWLHFSLVRKEICRSFQTESKIGINTEDLGHEIIYKLLSHNDKQWGQHVVMLLCTLLGAKTQKLSDDMIVKYLQSSIVVNDFWINDLHPNCSVLPISLHLFISSIFPNTLFCQKKEEHFTKIYLCCYCFLDISSKR